MCLAELEIKTAAIGGSIPANEFWCFCGQANKRDKKNFFGK